MPNPCRLWTMLLILVLASPCSAQESMLDLIPEGAAGAISIRNLKELEKKGDKFVADAKLDNFGLRPSQLFGELYRFLGVQGNVDETGSAAIMLLDPRSVGIQKDLGLDVLEEIIVGVLPYRDRDKIAASFGLEKEMLMDGVATAVKQKPGGIDIPKFILVRGKHVFIGNSARAIDYAAKAKSISKHMADDRRKLVNESDIMIHLGAKAWEEMWKSTQRTIENDLARFKDAEERKIIEQTLNAVADVRFAVGAVQVGDGLSIQVMTEFEPKHDSAGAKLLTLLGSGQGSSNLNGLPEGKVLLAQAARGDGKATGLLAKVFFDEILRNSLEIPKIISPAERPLFVGVFNEVWQRLEGNKMAIYSNDNVQQNGLFSVVAILDTANAGEFLTEMRTLAKIADGTGLKLDPDGAKKDIVDLEKLVRNLGSPVYRRREAASVKLRLAGEAALPYLEKAKKSDDAEVVRRAEELHAQISELAAERRKDVIAADPLRSVRPTFALIPKAEDRGGKPVDVLRINLPKDAVDARKQMEQLFGPQWHNMRLATHGKQIIVLLGSDVSLMDKTLSNLDQNKPGLGGSASMKKSYERSPAGRKFELHLAVAQILAKVLEARGGAAPANGDADALTSWAVSVEPSRLQMDIHLPIAAVRAVAKGGGF